MFRVWTLIRRLDWCGTAFEWPFRVNSGSRWSICVCVLWSTAKWISFKANNGSSRLFVSFAAKVTASWFCFKVIWKRRYKSKSGWTNDRRVGVDHRYLDQLIFFVYRRHCLQVVLDERSHGSNDCLEWLEPSEQVTICDIAWQDECELCSMILSQTSLVCITTTGHLFKADSLLDLDDQQVTQLAVSPRSFASSLSLSALIVVKNNKWHLVTVAQQMLITALDCANHFENHFVFVIQKH